MIHILLDVLSFVWGEVAQRPLPFRYRAGMDEAHRAGVDEVAAAPYMLGCWPP